jgi:hypothetical protein
MECAGSDLRLENVFLFLLPSHLLEEFAFFFAGRETARQLEGGDDKQQAGDEKQNVNKLHGFYRLK